MAADIVQVMRILRLREIDVRLKDGRLVAKYRRGALPEDMYSFIAHFKDRIVEYLTAEASRDAEYLENVS